MASDSTTTAIERRFTNEGIAAPAESYPDSSRRALRYLVSTGVTGMRPCSLLQRERDDDPDAYGNGLAVFQTGLELPLLHRFESLLVKTFVQRLDHGDIADLAVGEHHGVKGHLAFDTRIHGSLGIAGTYLFDNGRQRNTIARCVNLLSGERDSEPKREGYASEQTHKTTSIVWHFTLD